MQAWVEADEMPPCPMSEKKDGRVSPKWANAHQMKPAYVDLEFLYWTIDPCLITEVCIWRYEEPAPVTWRLRPPPSHLEHIRKHEPWKWSSIEKAAKVNGFNEDEWSDAPHWHDVREPIAKALFNRIIIGSNIWAADIRRLEALFDPYGQGWIKPHSSVDIQFLATIKGHKDKNLDALCKAYGIPPEDIHHAEGGVRRVRAVCEAMLGVRDGGSDRVDGQNGDSAPVQRGRTTQGVRDADA